MGRSRIRLVDQIQFLSAIYPYHDINKVTPLKHPKVSSYVLIVNKTDEPVARKRCVTFDVYFDQGQKKCVTFDVSWSPEVNKRATKS